MPHIGSKIHTNIFYSATVSETLRIDLPALYFSDFLPKISFTFEKKILNKKQADFSKFNKDTNYPIRKIFSNNFFFVLINSYLFISTNNNNLFIFFSGMGRDTNYNF